MTVVVDTNVLIDHLRGRPEARRRLEQAVEASIPLFASTLTRVELLAGMRSDERTATRTLVDAMRWTPVTNEIAERAGALARSHRSSHREIGIVDYVIAATTETLHAELWTLNVRHFPMFPELAPPYQVAGGR